MNIFIASIKRDLKIAFRNPISLFNPLIFFLIATSLFPLAISPEAEVLREIAVGIIWVLVLLAVLLTLNTLFADDFDNGLLEQIIISHQSPILVVLAKTCSHFILTGLPIILLTPVMSLLLFMEWQQVKILLLTLILTTPTLSLIGVIGAALTAGLKHSAMLLFLIILPFYVPLLIFAAGAVHNFNIGLDISGALYFLSTMLVLMLMLSPPISSYALKTSLE
jgi:heme exporter protein B